MLPRLFKRHLVDSFLIPVLGISLMAVAPVSQATSDFLVDWRSIADYQNSLSDDNALCALCHTTINARPNDEFNPYGVAIRDNGATTRTARILAVQNEDSDGDPTNSSNRTEILASTQPGWTGTAPAEVIGDLDPSTVNEPPVADANGPYFGTAGQQVQFDGSGSTDPDGVITAYDWTFGDGGTGTGVAPSHTYAAAGTYIVSLTVVDDEGAISAPANTTASISPIPQEDPIADPNGPYVGTEGVAVVFDGSASFDPDGGSITQYDWDFGDGNTGTGVAPSHTYAAAGTYIVSLTVVDDEGAISAPATTTADIADDTDGDGIADNQDNCTLVANGPLIPDAGGNSQLDTDGDNFGNICDPDYNGDLAVNASDLADMKAVFFTENTNIDLNGDGDVNAADLAIMKAMFFGPPGPSGLVQ